MGKKTLMNQFFDSHSSKQNTKIDNRHERCLRLIYSGRRSCYGKRMEKDDLFLFIIGRFRYLQLKCLKSKVISHLRHSVSFFYLSKHLNELLSQIMNEVFHVNPSVSTLWGIRMIYILENANQWVKGPRQSCFLAIKSDQ